MSSSGAVSLADIFLTFFPLIAASASSFAFFFIFSSLMPLRIASRVFSASSFFVTVALFASLLRLHPSPSNPALHVHLHDPVLPPTVPPEVQ